MICIADLADLARSKRLDGKLQTESSHIALGDSHDRCKQRCVILISVQVRQFR